MHVINSQGLTPLNFIEQLTQHTGQSLALAGTGGVPSIEDHINDFSIEARGLHELVHRNFLLVHPIYDTFPRAHQASPPCGFRPALQTIDPQ